VAAAGKAFPRRSEVILPPTHVRLWCTPMFDEQEMTAGFENPAHFLKRVGRQWE
jgi:hypothetical protein